jgi:hypothetical protein
MPVLQPTELPTWSNSPTGPENTPVDTAALEATGWSHGERPAAQHFNWLFHYIFKWILFLYYYMGNWHQHYFGNQLHSPSWTLDDATGTPYMVWSCGSGTTGNLFLSLPTRRGCVVKSVTIYCSTTNATVTDISARLAKYTVTLAAAGPGSSTDIVASTNLPNATTNVQALVLTPGADYEVAEYEHLFVRIVANHSASTQKVFGVVVNYGSP